MAGSSRLEELRRRVESDPASIAFAQLAEEYRRVGNFERAVEVCRAGLARHPDYASARVTLGRALIDLDQLGAAEVEMRRVLTEAPDNLAAIRGLAEIHRRHGDGPNSRKAVSAGEAQVVRPTQPVVQLSPEPEAEAGGRDQRVITALEAWLSAIHVARAHSHA
jgi:predicted Zn-dependent protease